MERQNHYLVLGVPRVETAEGIRSAFRDRALEHHPDRAGPDGAERFREVVDAYRVLSDPQRRRAYDASLSRVNAAESGRNVPRGGRPARSPRPPRAAAAMGRTRYLCQVVLSRREAQAGGVLPVRLPEGVMPLPIPPGVREGSVLSAWIPSGESMALVRARIHVRG